MKTQTLGSSDLQVTRIAYGCMPLGGAWDDSPISESTRQEALRSIHAALDQGMNFYDHADIYCIGKSEEVFSAIWQEVPGLRSKIILQSKCGIRFAGEPNPGSPHRFDFSYAHILRSVENSLKRLKTDYLDVLLLHRPDPLVEPEEVARAFDELHQAGKVRWFGVSNHTAAQLDLLRAFVRQPIVTNQVAFNLIHTGMLDEGIVFNQDSAMLSRATRARSSTAACTTSPCSPGARWPGGCFPGRRRTCHPRRSPAHLPWWRRWRARRASPRRRSSSRGFCATRRASRRSSAPRAPSASPRPARQTGSSWTARNGTACSPRVEGKVCRKLKAT